MKKHLILGISMLISCSVFAQKKQDTVVLTSGYVKLGGVAYDVQSLSKALSQSVVVSTDQYWATLYDFLMTAKNPNYSAAQVSELANPFLPYVERFQRNQKK